MSADLREEVAGSTKSHLPEWSEITADPIILQNVEGFRLQFDSKPVQGQIPRQYKFNEQHAGVIDKEIHSLLQKDVITEVNDITDHFISNIFLREKTDGKFRMIIDLSDLNDHVTKHHFKMDHLETATNMMFPGAWLTSIDLKEAYYAIPLHEEDRKYICFQWNNKYYEFTCLPFGLSSAPWIYTKTLRPIFADFHSKGFSGFGYIDDSFIISETFEESVKATKYLCEIFTKLGFRVHPEKSKLIPSHTLVFLGYKLDTSNMSVSPTKEKITKVENKISQLLSKSKPKIREVASVLGSINDLCKASNYGLSHTKALEIDKIKALRSAGKKQFEGSMKISYEGKQDLKWWYTNLHNQRKDIRISPPQTTLFCDASGEGWGASFGYKRAGGRWSVEEGHLHINVLELKAIDLALKSLCSQISNCGLQIFSDNTTAIAYLKHGGGTKSSQCNDIAISIWAWCAHRDIWFLVTHVPGVENVEADYESRHFSENTEWSINPDIFRDISQKLGVPDIDLFASRNNNKVSCYASWGPDPHASYVNAFHVNWSKFKLCYIFPPFRLLNRVIQKIREENAKAIVVSPNWPAQPWYSILHKKASRVLFYKKMENNLIQSVVVKKPQTKSIDDIPLCVFLLC